MAISLWAALTVAVLPHCLGVRFAQTCTDAEMSQFALELAFGPRPVPPRCVPLASQELMPLALQPHVQSGGLLAAATVATVASRHNVSATRQTGNTDNVFAHLLVVQSNNDWCEAPCSQPTWELASPKPQSGSSYSLLEAAIWGQERRVALYRFDAEWEKKARKSYHEICGGKGHACPAYRAFREAQALLSVGPWPENLDQDGAGLSAWLKDAFDRVFARMHEEESGASRFALSYNGHGGNADGALFAGVLFAPDAANVLRTAIAKPPLAPQLAILNFGGNCAEGRWGTLAGLHWAAQWIIASDHNVGGLNLDGATQEQQTAMVEADGRLSDSALIKRAAEQQTSTEELVKQMISARLEIWGTVSRKFIERQGLRQSIAAYHTAEYSAFAEALRKDYGDASPDLRSSFVTALEKTECDVLAGARALDASGGLEAKFSKLRPFYASTKKITKWKVETNGLGFNFVGFNAPPCELNQPVGAPKVESELEFLEATGGNAMRFLF